MATKAALAAALLVAMLAFATAFDQENWQQCGMMLQGHRFPTCQRFLRQMGPSGDQPSLQGCCQELRNMDHQQCACQAIRHALLQAQQGIASTSQLYERARSLPQRCGLHQQQCSFNFLFL